MIIRNGNVFQEDGSYRKMDLYVENGRIVSSEEEVSDKEEIDASGLKVLPGLVDIHSHGAVGHDFSDADATGLKKILKYEKAHGITSYCPTSMTLPMEQLIRIFASATEVEQDDSCARIVGLNMEGPFLDPAKKGAHVEEYIRKPDIRFFDACFSSIPDFDRKSTVIVGDSLSSDIAGGRMAGITTLWINSGSQTSNLPDMEVKNLEQAADLIFSLKTKSL